MLFVAALSWSGTTAAAVCSSSDYVLTAQSEVDALGAVGCDSVSGSLEISNSTDITNLNGLANITSIRGYLNIDSNAALANLDGLANLTDVGALSISNNTALANLDGLASLTSVGGDLQIEYNEALTNLDGLASLTSLAGGLYVAANPALTNLNGLTSITSVGSFLSIASNMALTNLDGLANITSVGRFLAVGGNAALTNLDGLANITNVGESLSISGNATITNLDGLANLSGRVLGWLTIKSNAALTNVDGLANLSGSIESLGIYKNLALTNLDGLANLTSVGGYLEINGNAKLTNLDGLANITSVEADLYIGSNAALTNLDGLANITSIGEGLFIQSNWNASCEGVAPLLGWPMGPPDDSVNGAITINSNAMGCNSVEEVLASVSGPTQPTISNAIAGVGSSIELQFSASTTTDTAFPVTSYEAACIGSSTDLNETPAIPLLDNTPIIRTLTVSDYDPVAVLSDIEVDIDITHSDPADLYITLTTPQGTKLVLWDQGGSGGKDIVGTFPTTLIPIDTISTAGKQAMDGDWVLNVEDVDVGPLVREGVLNAWGLRITEELAASESSSPIELLDATLGRDYSCTVAPVTALGVLPVSAPYFVTVPPPTTSDSFNSLLQTVQNVRGAGSSQQQATSETSADVGEAKKEGASAQARAVAATGEPASIPTVPHHLLLIISSLVGLFGLRRLRA